MEEKKQFIRDFSPKDEVDCFFMVKYLNVAEGRDGRSYLNLILADASGEIESRMWANPEKVVKHISKGDVVRAQGKVNLYQNRKQLVVTRLERIEKENVNLSALVPSSNHSPDEMYSDLLSLVKNRCDDRFIQPLLLNILETPEIKRRLLIWPAGKSIHHNYQAGLLEHILSCSHLALELSSHYGVNQNYVLAGCILHDLCKIFELTEGPVTDYSFEGKLVGHLVGGVEMVEEYSRQIPGFPHETKIHLKHILLSHHGELSFGSPKSPQTLEAMLVHLIDFMDSRMNSMVVAKQADKNEGDWTGYIKHLDRVIFCPDLPHYPIGGEKAQSRPVIPEHGTSSRPGPLRQNLGKLLSGIKIETE